jgi:hypothetical protein
MESTNSVVASLHHSQMREYGLYDGARVYAVGYFTPDFVREANKRLRDSMPFRWVYSSKIQRAVRKAKAEHAEEINSEREKANHAAGALQAL